MILKAAKANVLFSLTSALPRLGLVLAQYHTISSLRRFVQSPLGLKRILGVQRAAHQGGAMLEHRIHLLFVSGGFRQLLVEIGECVLVLLVHQGLFFLLERLHLDVLLSHRFLHANLSSRQ